MAAIRARGGRPEQPPSTRARRIRGARVPIVQTAGVAATFGLILLVLAGVAATAHTLLRRGPDWED